MSGGSKEKAIAMLCRKSGEIGRLPKKDDFQPEEVGFIKQILGPWPRALEKAGLKEVSRSYINKKARIKASRKKKREKYKKYKENKTENKKANETLSI